jgi:cytochrome P450
MTAPFTPPFPARDVPPARHAWSGLFGERARNAVYGWSDRAFAERHLKFKVVRFTVHVPLEPESIQRVLLDNAANYVKPNVVKKLLDAIIGRGLLTSDGALWREQRRIVSASFAPPAIEAFAPAFAAAADERSGAWRDGEIRDMAAEATATTMAVIADTLFSGDPRLKTEQAMAHITAALDSTAQARITAIFGLPQIGWTPALRRGIRGRRFLRGILGTLVRERIAAGGGGDFLADIVEALQARFPPDEAAALAFDNAVTFYLAGHETTANALAWTLFLLSEQPELQAAVAEEARSAQGDEERLPLLRRVIEESMRLYPPVPRFDRQAVAADRLGDYDVAPGDIISIWPWLIHRHQALWTEPDRFDPDRFLADRRAQQHRFQYLPFGGGPRICVGMRFAMREAVVILARWLADWSFVPIEGRIVAPSGAVTLRPKGGLRLILRRRTP